MNNPEDVKNARRREYEPCEHCGKKPTSKKKGKPQNKRYYATELCELMGWDDVFHVMNNSLSIQKLKDATEIIRKERQRAEVERDLANTATQQLHAEAEKASKAEAKLEKAETCRMATANGLEKEIERLETKLEEALKENQRLSVELGVLQAKLGICG